MRLGRYYAKRILSMDEAGNNNWEKGKRADNAISVVYLFKPIKQQNSFPNYGVALLEVDCKAVENKMPVRDTHKNDYIEYITDRVSPSEIKKVIIPEVFSSYIDIPNGIDITWCSLRAEHYGDNGLEMADKKVLEMFAKTSNLMDSTYFNFFRGKNDDKSMIDLYNIQYIY